MAKNGVQGGQRS